MIDIEVTRHDIHRLINGDGVEFNLTHCIVRIKLMPSEVPIIPEGFDVVNRVVTEITKCEHLDSGYCAHPMKGIVVQRCNLNECPLMTENERNIREEDERRIHADR